MVFISRKIIYPIFVAVFAIAFFMLVYLVSFSNDILVDNAEFSFSGENVVLKMDLINTSNHVLRDVSVMVVMGQEEQNEVIAEILPGEKVLFEKTLPVSKTFGYDIYIRVPFNRPVFLSLVLDESTVRPVVSEVSLSNPMVVGEQYNIGVTLKNVSKSDLLEVYWITSAEGSFFEESFFPRSVALKSGESKTLYSTLTPISPGNVKLNFVLKIGDIEQKSSHTVTILSE
jgi:hypothetical protein